MFSGTFILYEVRIYDKCWHTNRDPRGGDNLKNEMPQPIFWKKNLEKNEISHSIECVSDLIMCTKSFNRILDHQISDWE